MLFIKHTYLEVALTQTNSENTKEEDIKIIVELDFWEKNLSYREQIKNMIVYFLCY